MKKQRRHYTPEEKVAIRHTKGGAVRAPTHSQETRMCGAPGHVDEILGLIPHATAEP